MALNSQIEETVANMGHVSIALYFLQKISQDSDIRHTKAPMGHIYMIDKKKDVIRHELIVKY